MNRISRKIISVFFVFPLLFVASCSSVNYEDIEEGTYFGSIDSLDSTYIKYEKEKLYHSFYGDYYAVYSKVDDNIKEKDNIKTHAIKFKFDKEATNKLYNGYTTEEGKEGLEYFTLFFIYNNEDKESSPSLLFINSSDENIDINNSKIAVGSAEKIVSSKFPEIIFKEDNNKESEKKDTNKKDANKKIVINEKKDAIYRLDGLESKYTYSSLLVKNAVKEAEKIAKKSFEDYYVIKENEMGELYITVYSLKVQDEIIENYIFDPYTKKIKTNENQSSVTNNTESVSKVINEAIIEVEKQTSYSNQDPYIISGYVTDEGFIEIDIGIADKNNPGEVITQDQAIYNPKTETLKEFPKNNLLNENSDNLTDESLFEEAITNIEEKTGYIEGIPYKYEAYLTEEGIIEIEVRAEGSGNGGTMSLVDRFQYIPQNKEIYIYDIVSNKYKEY